MIARRFGLEPLSVRLPRVWQALCTEWYTQLTWRWFHRRSKPHPLRGRLIVSLTSYPPRYRTLPLTLKGLIAQSVRPDAISLSIGANDIASLPPRIHRLAKFGVEVNASDDDGSYNKLVPALRDGRSDVIVICDDDAYYDRHWLRRMIASYREGSNEVLAARAHHVTLGSDGLPLPYLEWEHDVPVDGDGPGLFATGVGGVLYEPAALHADVTRKDLYKRLCPTSDDVWFYWMARRNGSPIRKIGGRRNIVSWHGSQKTTLYSANVLTRSGNDDAVRAMIDRYGFPDRP